MLSRRRFLQATSLAAAMGSAAHAKKLQNVGVQLYTVRNILPDKPAETLRALDAIGYREVEGNFADLGKIVPGLAGTHMKLVSVHTDIPTVLKGKDDDLARAAAEVKKSGASYAVFPYLPPADRGGLDAIRRLAERLNRAGEKFHAAGLAFCYHNHAFEFEPMEGATPLQTLMDHTDKKLVGLEMDAFWVSVAGHDPAEMLQKLSGRVRLLHLKDKAQGTPVIYKETPGKAAFKEIGNGVLDWPKILRAAAAANVEHFFVEQDQTPGDPIESLRQSMQYLKKLDY
jgi:sugar phosphate isomerase/epimerase